MKHFLVAAVVAIIMAPLTLISSPAHAETVSPTPLAQAFPDAAPAALPTSGVRMHYNSWWVGSFRDYQNPVYTFGNDVFLAAGAGQGQPVKNNAASICNFDTRNARVFFNSGWAGPSDFVPAKTCMNLVNTYNENASWRWD